MTSLLTLPDAYLKRRVILLGLWHLSVIESHSTRLDLYSSQEKSNLWNNIIWVITVSCYRGLIAASLSLRSAYFWQQIFPLPEHPGQSLWTHQTTEPFTPPPTPPRTNVHLLLPSFSPPFFSHIWVPSTVSLGGKCSRDTFLRGMPLICSSFSVSITLWTIEIIQAVTCYTRFNSSRPYPVIGSDTVDSQRGCEVLCTANSQVYYI